MKLYMKILVLSASIIISSLYTNVTLSLSYMQMLVYSPIYRIQMQIYTPAYRLQLSSAAKNIGNAGYNNGTRGE